MDLLNVSQERQRELLDAVGDIMINLLQENPNPNRKYFMELVFNKELSKTPEENFVIGCMTMTTWDTTSGLLGEKYDNRSN